LFVRRETGVGRKILVSIIGGHDAEARTLKLAYDAGKIVAESGAVLVCGGLKGVMEAAAQGAKEAQGTTIGLLPGKEKADANPFIDIAIPTTIGYARNVMVACSGDVIIALPGSHGTLCEICYGFVYKRPILDLGGWKRKGMICVKDLKDAKVKLQKLIKKLAEKE
jgi:uncharacterized protein (TIGR00725 family)